MNKEDCKCQQLENPHYKNYLSRTVGIDKNHGEVNIQTCIFCDQSWLRYFIEYESFSQSGRWYSGMISERDANKITPENAIAFLEKLDWCFCGGSYFGGKVFKRKGKLNLL